MIEADLPGRQAERAGATAGMRQKGGGSVRAGRRCGVQCAAVVVAVQAVEVVQQQQAARGR